MYSSYVPPVRLGVSCAWEGTAAMPRILVYFTIKSVEDRLTNGSQPPGFLIWLLLKTRIK